MNKYNPNKHHRKSIRLKGYDYTQAGLYFVTICVQNRKCLFGDIVGADLCVIPNDKQGVSPNDEQGVIPNNNTGVGPQMKLNDAGKMIEKWYLELENKFPDIQCGTHIVMPNHFHCIIHNVGADLRACPGNDEHKPILDEHTGSSLHRVVQWFKTMTTNEYIRNVKNNNWKRFNGKLWQRNYWEHIIRNEKSHQNISDYIINNPIKWNADKLKPNS